MMYEFNGILRLDSNGEERDILYLGYDEDSPLAERLEFMVGNKCSVRYWITNSNVSKEGAQVRFIEAMIGENDIEYWCRYSEATGYLWTDENIVVGGHDLLSELKSNVGLWLFLEVEI